MKNSDMPAMPMMRVITKGSYNGIDTYEVVDGYEGLTKREQFSAMAMQGLLSSDYPNGSEKMPEYDVALMAVSYADALLAELEKEPNE